MKAITTDAWDDELWGISKAQSSNNNKTRLYFYFGTDDHWVANETRDELIAARAATGKVGEEDKPTMEVDTYGTPHGFCISKSSSHVQLSSFLTEDRAQRFSCEESRTVHRRIDAECCII
jgi:dienelactone hydrolase